MGMGRSEAWRLKAVVGVVSSTIQVLSIVEITAGVGMTVVVEASWLITTAVIVTVVVMVVGCVVAAWQRVVVAETRTAGGIHGNGTGGEAQDAAEQETKGQTCFHDLQRWVEGCVVNSALVMPLDATFAKQSGRQVLPELAWHLMAASYSRPVAEV
jgi:hypothetical protein